MPAAPARAVIREHANRQIGQAKYVVKSTIGEQPSIGCDRRAMELKLQPAIKVKD